MIGAAIVISVDPGEVPDYHVLSKTCQKCSQRKTECEGDEEKLYKWRTEHITAGECDINFTGSSPAMEAECAVIMWKRSIMKHNLRYRWIVSDGDSKAFNPIENVYDGCKVIKLDCAGHVQKWKGKDSINPKSRTKGNWRTRSTYISKDKITAKVLWSCYSPKYHQESKSL